MTSFFRSVVVGGVLAIVAASCSSGPSDALAFSDPDSAPSVEASETTSQEPGLDAESASSEFVVDSGDVIAFQASWLCELQRRNFADLDALDAALDEALSANGVGRADYDDFLASLPESQELRDEVLSLFEQRCRA